ncbi:MAG: Crp/Fnr family transcriptional regulator [Bacteroidales bacterium]|nr:Crp/Fnr family transcriptional regulator [Bacteroidales bacterium]
MSERSGSIYDVLLELPLFQGLSVQQLTGIIEKIPFLFTQYAAGDVIVKPDSDHDQVTFVLRGRVRLTTPVCGGNVVVSQEFEAPFTAPFHYLFGAQNRTSGYLEAITDTGVMQVSKSSFLDMVQSNRIILLHVLNMLSSVAQLQRRSLDYLEEKQLELRLAKWLLSISHHRTQLMWVEASEPVLAEMLRMRPADLWRSIAVWEGKGCVEVTEGRLKLTDRYALKRYVSANSFR